jgi:hypothetical protein
MLLNRLRNRILSGSELHGNGILGVADNVPTGLLCGVRKKRMRAGNIFFRLQGVGGVLGFSTLVGDGQQAPPVNGTGRLPRFGIGSTNVEPKGVEKIKGQQESQCNPQEAGKPSEG